MSAAAASAGEGPLPAWSLPAGATDGIGLAVDWPFEVTREWAWGGSTGRGVRVCILDSGIEHDHPAGAAGRRARSPSSATRTERSRSSRTTRATSADTARPARGSSGRSLPSASSSACACSAPATRGAGPVLLAGLRWAIEQRLRRRQHEPLDDQARARGRAARAGGLAPTSARTMLVASAHNLPVESYPWRFASVHVGRQPRPGRPVRRSSTTPNRPSSSSPAGSTSTSAWLERLDSALHRQQLCDARI